MNSMPHGTPAPLAGVDETLAGHATAALRRWLARGGPAMLTPEDCYLAGWLAGRASRRRAQPGVLAGRDDEDVWAEVAGLVDEWVRGLEACAACGSHMTAHAADRLVMLADELDARRAEAPPPPPPAVIRSPLL